MSPPHPPPFLAIEEFWRQFFELSSRPCPPAREPAALNAYCEGVFGNLTRHEFGPLGTVPFEIRCAGCTNNTPGRRDAVCRTHVGVLRGVLQAATHVPLNATYQPSPGQACRITLSLASGPDGTPLVPYAGRLDQVRLIEEGDRRLLVDDRNGGVFCLTVEAHRLLSLLATERAAPALVAASGLATHVVRCLLDDFYARGWIYCRFDRPGEAVVEAKTT